MVRFCSKIGKVFEEADLRRLDAGMAQRHHKRLISAKSYPKRQFPTIIFVCSICGHLAEAKPGEFQAKSRLQRSHMADVLLSLRS
jgi:rubrerythrin